MTWTVGVLTDGDLLTMPEIEAEIPVSEIYMDVELPERDADDP